MKRFSRNRRTLYLAGLVFGISIFLGGCLTPTQTHITALEGTTWTLVELDGAAIPGIFVSRPLTLQLDGSHHQVSGSSGINRMAGAYQLAGKRLKLGPFASTRMAGPPAAMDFETKYLRTLDRVDEWAIIEGKLELRSGAEVVALYREASPSVGPK